MQAVAVLQQTVPLADALITELQADGQVLSRLRDFARKSWLEGYAELYLNRQNLISFMLLTLMPAEQILNLGKFVGKLNPEELSAFANQSVKNLVSEPHKLDEILDPLLPENVEKLDPATFTDRQKIFFVTFLLWFHETLAFLVHGRALTDLVKSAINGDDESFILAAHVDPCVLSIPYFHERALKALACGSNEGLEFIGRLTRRMQEPLLKGKIKQRQAWIALLILDNMNLLDGTLSRSELLVLLDDAGIDGIPSEDNLSRMLRTFRAYQDKA